MSLDVLVPCKRLAGGKSRLAGVLSPEQRFDLCRSFFDATVELGHRLGPGVRVAVVSEDTGVCERARRLGAIAIAEPGNGLNDAIAHANRMLEATVGPRDLLVLPIDLPNATPHALLVVLGSRGDIAIVPDRREDGTNVLLLRSRARTGFPFSYGSRSFARHTDLAAMRGLRPAVVRQADLMLDVDSGEDLILWRSTAKERVEGYEHAVEASLITPETARKT
ncbi:2-phospho-L-lactate guanylyltransferase [Mesorhizobium sp. J18]|uniref:2-phospho-L-lactate guanylyltransferase n=1 Tax=Mesorhizobium sp. J18 TaxID=935263 RepID=UPI00119991C6|nr:2-phospho-L-lactate guanylyltransferase [Mesorhizobium sp. J18]TWG94250.1 2-phospho-L-lactate guanylyltransferase [Mesorhizobium sp. J18]